MPRQNAPRTLQSEDNLAQRIAYEREQRGLSYEGLAQRLTDVGCPIQGSAIFKIEKGTPRRRISVDELVAFGKVFDVRITDLVVPLDLILDVAAREALYSIAHAAGEFHAAVESGMPVATRLLGAWNVRTMQDALAVVDRIASMSLR